MLESWRKSSTKENQQKTSKNSSETHKKHQKSEIKDKEVNSLDIPWLLETWMEQEKSSTQKSAKNNNSSSNSLRKEIFRPKNSQKSGLNSQKHTIRILIHLKKNLRSNTDYFEALSWSCDFVCSSLFWTKTIFFFAFFVM